jgi:septum formation protein
MQNLMSDIILASKSQVRAQLLTNAGIKFTVRTLQIDERAVEESLGSDTMPPHDIAEILAIAKAEPVSAASPSDLVIGADQTLSFENHLLHKPEDMESARRRLLAMSGKPHELHSAICIVHDGSVLWSHVETATILFRELSPQFIGRYLAATGDSILSSVGAYQIEGLGLQLIERMEGDIFTIMGLPMLALLKQLRHLEAIES